MKKIFIIIFVCIAFNSIGQESWSLEKCIDYAYENNIQLKQRVLDIKYAKNSNLQNKLDFLPSVSAQASHSFNFGRTISFTSNAYVNENNQNTNLSIGTNVLLFNGFKKINTFKKGKLYLKLKEKDIEKTKCDLAVEIAGLYLQVLYNTEFLNIKKEQLDISKEQYKKSSRLVDVGKLAEIELLKQKSLVSQDELSVVEAQNNLDIAYINLFQVLDVRDEEVFKVLNPTNLLVDANRSIQSSSNLYEKALVLRPEIFRADINIESFQKEVSIVKASLMPSLSASAGWGSGYADNFVNPITKQKDGFFDQISNNDRKDIRLNLSIPIFSGLKARMGVKNARLQVDNARFEKENAKNVLRKEIQQVYANAKASMKKYYAAEIASDYGKESFHYSQQKYNAGLIDLLSYKEMKKEYINSLSKLIQAKYDYVFRTKILDYYIGLPMKL